MFDTHLRDATAKAGTDPNQSVNHSSSALLRVFNTDRSAFETQEKAKRLSWHLFVVLQCSQSMSWRRTP